MKNSVTCCAKIILSILFSGLIFGQALAQGACDAILRSGVFNTYSYLDVSRSRSDFYNRYCQRSSETQKRAMSIAGHASDYRLNFGQSSDNARRSEICNETRTSNEEQRFVRALQSIAAPEIVTAWSRCVENGIFMNTVRLDGNSVPITIEYRNSSGIPFATVNSPPQVRGATCTSLPALGTRIISASSIAICERREQRAVLVAINTDRGSAMLYSPLPEPPPYLITLRGRQSVPHATTRQFSFPTQLAGTSQDITNNPWAFVAPRDGRFGIAVHYQLSNRVSYVSCDIRAPTRTRDAQVINSFDDSDRVGDKQIRTCQVEALVVLQRGERLTFNFGQAGYTSNGPAVNVEGQVSIYHAD